MKTLKTTVPLGGCSKLRKVINFTEVTTTSPVKRAGHVQAWQGSENPQTVQNISCLKKSLRNLNEMGGISYNYLIIFLTIRLEYPTKVNVFCTVIMNGSNGK